MSSILLQPSPSFEIVEAKERVSKIDLLGVMIIEVSIQHGCSHLLNDSKK